MRNRFARNNLVGDPSHRLREALEEKLSVAEVRREVVEGARSAGQFIGDHPLLCLGVGFLGGMILGWWAKRT